MNDRTRSTSQQRSRSAFGLAMAVPAVVKAICGSILTVLVVVVWQQLIDLEKQRELSGNWQKIQDYAVFYPVSVGNDRQEFETGGNASTISEARDLFPALEQAGALYIDAVNYEVGVPKGPLAPWPAAPIRVNTNYLKQYPIMDDSGAPIDIKDDERAWVVAVPKQFKAQEAQLTEYLRKVRTGGPGFVGAVQAHERIVGEPAPEQFTHQEVRIVWMASGQKVFAFNSKVNPDGGNTITDPVVEIMTRANSLPVDRFNAINGDPNSPLKVRVDGDPAGALNSLTPKLKELRLDDNLRHLVTGQQAMAERVSNIRSGITLASAFAGGALLVMLALSATLVVVGSDRLRRRLTVRRLHGIGFARSYRELLIALGTTWLAQTLVAGAVVVVLEMYSVSMPDQEVNPLAQLPKLLAVVAASLVIEALLVVVTAGIVERRNAVKRLKEL